MFSSTNYYLTDRYDKNKDMKLDDTEMKNVLKAATPAYAKQVTQACFFSKKKILMHASPEHKEEKVQRAIHTHTHTHAHIHTHTHTHIQSYIHIYIYN